MDNNDNRKRAEEADLWNCRVDAARDKVEVEWYKQLSSPDRPGASLPICDPYEKLHDGPNPDHLNVSRRSISRMNGIVLHSCPWRLNDLLSQKNALKTGTLVEPGTTHDMAVNHQPQPHPVCLSRWSAQHERCLPGDCVLAIGDLLMDSNDRSTPSEASITFWRSKVFVQTFKAGRGGTNILRTLCCLQRSCAHQIPTTLATRLSMKQ